MRSVRRTWTSRATARERGGIVGMRIPSQRRGCVNAAQLWDQLIFYAAILSSTGASIQSVSAQRETTGETFHTAAPDRTVGKKNKKRTTGASNVVTADGGKHQTEPEDREGKQAS